MAGFTTVASIQTRYYGPTNHTGSRIRVSDGGPFDEKPRTLWVAWEYSLNAAEMHRSAAQEYLNKYNEGATLDGPGYGFDNDYYWTWTRP